MDVYPYLKSKPGSIHFLIFKRSKNVQYSGQWRMVGGKVEDDETAWEAGLRELQEESGARPKLYWNIPSVNHFYNKRLDKVELIPAFAAELSPSQNIVLNREHSEFKWIEISQINTFIAWPEQQRLMKLVGSIISNKQLLDDWKILSR